MKITFRGFEFDTRTVAMILWAEKKAGFKFRIAQGSYSTDVSASAGTHDGGGAVDFSVRLMTAKRVEKMLNALKDAGFAAWSRPKTGVWNPHVHAIAIGCPDLAPIAKRQVSDYDKGLDGLVGHKPDSSYRPTPPVKYSIDDKKPVPRRKSTIKETVKKTVAKTTKKPASKVK